MTVTTKESSSEPPQPSRLLKKRNMLTLVPTQEPGTLRPPPRLRRPVLVGGLVLAGGAGSAPSPGDQHDADGEDQDPQQEPQASPAPPPEPPRGGHAPPGPEPPPPRT